MLLTIDHQTRYRFDEPVAHGLQRLRLTPKATSGQSILDWEMTLQGATVEAEYEDQNHNRTTLIALDQGTRELTVTCRGAVRTADQAGVIGRHAGHLPLWHFLDNTAATRPGPRMRALVSSLPVEDDHVTTLHRMSAAVIATVEYAAGHTDAETSAEEALVGGRGVCQDHAQIFVGCARMLGIPARYVSGYLMMDDRIEQEASHAWAEAHIDGLGWVGFDVSNGISPDPRYVRVATGRDYREAAPVTGISYGGGDASMHVRLAVERQHVEQ
ncbi:transglutaminase family protein [Novosphingobium sp. Gsoil 351]|uniref:transglutaminase family protein n=1 Tax=Novosphingobium sp. Gsoil 351 TaxID=2675225 RepID=UPI0012B47870|nr:transglutaminase family protein [Novosphingobium sp. Gsoil 351]QGN53191.1 transglutaminase family protein [Novosphingobium sp. Gsoil 351]QGN56197.1 transglutaminase family protein [Novosphingobium sp. Gsoil 351]